MFFSSMKHNNSTIKIILHGYYYLFYYFMQHKLHVATGHWYKLVLYKICTLLFDGTLLQYN